MSDKPKPITSNNGGRAAVPDSEVEAFQSIPVSPDVCRMDGRQIQVMSFKGTGVCSELCRKKDAGEITDAEYEEQRKGE